MMMIGCTASPPVHAEPTDDEQVPVWARGGKRAVVLLVALDARQHCVGGFDAGGDQPWE